MSSCDLAVEDVLVGADVGLERADVLPVARRRSRRTAACPSASSAGNTSLEKSTGSSAVDVVEDLGLEHVDAGVDGVAEHLAPRRLLEEALDRAVVAGDDDAELERVLDVGEPDGGHRLALVVERDDRAEVDVGEHVAGDHEEALVEQLAWRCATEPAVPSGVSSVAYVIVTPNSEPSPK